jgi:hypothetical protein
MTWWAVEVKETTDFFLPGSQSCLTRQVQVDRRPDETNTSDDTWNVVFFSSTVSCFLVVLARQDFIMFRWCTHIVTSLAMYGSTSTRVRSS